MNKIKNQKSKIKITIQNLKFLILVCNFAFCVSRFAFPCYAADIQFEATIDRAKIALGEAARLNLTFHGTQNIPAPALDKIEGFDARYVGPSTMVSIVNGVISSSVTHMYTLIPLKTGTFTVGPLSIQAQGKTFISKPITIEVVSASSGGGQPYSRGRPPQGPLPSKIDAEELKDRIFLIFSAGKTRAYLNEIIPLTIKLYVNRLGARDIQFPELETSDFSIEKFGQPKQYREELGGILYDVIEFTTSMFGIKPGEFTLGPVKLKCNLAVRRQSRQKRSPFDDDFFGGAFNDDIFDDFFGRYEAYPLELKSAELRISVLPLPREGEPQGFDGALGNFQLEVEAAPREVKAGDPITLKMKVKGEGAFDAVKCPKIESKEGFKIYDPQAKDAEGAKEFEQVLIPESEKVNQIPAVKFSFFNTKTGQYQVLTHDPIPITVSKSEEGQVKIVELPQAAANYPQKEELGRDIIYIKGSLGKIKRAGSYLYRNLAFWAVQLTVFVFFAGILLFHRQQEKVKTDARYARRLRAPAKARKGMQEVNRLLRAGKRDEFFDAAFRTVKEYLADRFHLLPGGITASTIEEIAKEKGLSGEILDKVKKIFSDCDMARYAPTQFGRETGLRPELPAGSLGEPGKRTLPNALDKAEERQCFYTFLWPQEKMREIAQSIKEVIDYLERQRI